MSQFRTKLFPWCVVPDDGSNVGDGTFYPAVVSLDKAMEWYWRVKKWELVVDTVPYGPVTASDIRFDPTIDPGTTERDLICPIIGSQNRYTTGGTGVIYQIWFYSGLDPVPAANAQVRSFGGDYYPQFTLDMILDVMVGTPTLSTWNRSPYTPSTITMTLDGFPIPMYTTDETGFISVDMYPTEWWPYAPTSGGADVWDTSDGSQLTGLTVID